MGKNLIKKYETEQRRTKVLELIAQGETYNTIAAKVGVTRQFVTDTLKKELASSNTPEQILELRQHQTETLISHTPRLHKRFLTQHNLTERFANKYEQIVEEEETGLYKFSYLYGLYKEELLNEHQEHHPDEEPDHTRINKEAKALASEEIAQYRARRKAIAEEMERTAKLGDQHMQTLLKHQERLAKLNGIDSPTTHTMMINHSDHEIKLSLQQDIKNLHRQQEIEPTQPVTEAEVVEENE